MNANGSKPGSGGSRRPAKKPMQFMFIDSTDHGVNAKPDKAVRSFVMKSARSKKPWSTRQKSPKAEREPNAILPEAPLPSPSGTHVETNNVSPSSANDVWFDLSSSPDLHSASSSRSSISSPTGSSTYSQPYFTPLSSPTLLCEKSDCNGISCGHSHASHSATDTRMGWDVGFLADIDCYPVKLDHKMRGIMHTFAHTYTENFIPMDHHKRMKGSTLQWVMNGMLSETGAPFIYAALTSVALLPAPGITARDALSYKTEAISHIHRLLSNPKTSVNDNNITAVFMLLCIEESRAADQLPESQLQKQAHLNGLKMMINQRGGLAALGNNPHLQTFILMHSVAHMIITFERPYVTLVDDAGQFQQYNVTSLHDQPSSARTLRLFRALELDPALFNIVTNAIVFVNDLTTSLDDINFPVTPLEQTKHGSLLLCRLFDWYKLGEEDSRYQRNPLDQSICLALMICVIIAVNSSYNIMIQTAAQKLKVSLSKCLLRWAKAPDLLIWALLMGALATHQSPNLQQDYAFFKQYCGLAFADQGFNESSNAEEILDRMRKCVWVPKLDGKVKRLLMGMGFCLGEDVVNSVESVEVGSAENIELDLNAVGKEHVVGELTSGRFFGKRSESL